VQEGSSLVLDHHEQQQRPRGYAPGFRGVLLVYGEERANAALIGELEQDGYEVRRASQPRTLAERCEPGQVDLVIFGMAPARGLEMLRALRANALAPGAASIPVLWMGTSSETTTGLLRAFDAGADDVTRHPLGYAELLARVRALMRRRHSLINGAAVLTHGPLTVDTLACAADIAGVPVELRPREFALLAHLAREPTRVHERQEVLRAVWAYQRPGTTRTVDTHAGRLRRKLAAAGANGWVCAVFGIGYRLAPVGSEAHGDRTPSPERSLTR
jgi:DNA-binding response OmpR family regulator